MQLTRVRLRVPASSANLGPGFDSVGLALDVWDEVEVELTGSSLAITPAGEGAAEVPRDERHLVYRSMLETWRRLGETAPRGVVLRTRNRVPHSRGMGSSATAIVAGVSAAAALAGVDVAGTEGRAVVNTIAGDLEGHPDNSSASVYGGLTLSWRDDEKPEWRTLSLAVDPAVCVLVCVPSSRLDTHTARAALPSDVPHGDAAANGARTALLVQALTQHPELLMPATQDRLHQEQRRYAYPRSMALVDRLRSSGVAAAVSGAGPSVLALTHHGGATVVEQAAELETGWQALRLAVPTSGVQLLDVR